jgi:hypothetical protein
MSPVQQLQPTPPPAAAAGTASTEDEQDQQQQQQQDQTAGSTQSSTSSITRLAEQQQQQQPSSAMSMLVLCDPRFQQSKQLLAGLDFAFPDAPKVRRKAAQAALQDLSTPVQMLLTHLTAAAAAARWSMLACIVCVSSRMCGDTAISAEFAAQK